MYTLEKYANQEYRRHYLKYINRSLAANRPALVTDFTVTEQIDMIVTQATMDLFEPPRNTAVMYYQHATPQDILCYGYLA